MTGNGTVIASIPAGGANDAAGNGNTRSTSTDNTVTYDVTLADGDDQPGGRRRPTRRARPRSSSRSCSASRSIATFSNADINLSSSTAGGTLIGEHLRQR